MALAVRQVKVSTRAGGADSINNTFASSVLAGSLLVAHTACYTSSGNSDAPVSDNVNLTWGTAAATGYHITGDSNSWVQLNAFPNSAAGAITVTANPTGTVADVDLTLMEITGAATSSPRDKSVTTANGTNGTITVTGVLSQANEIIIQSFSHTGSNATLTGDTADAFTQADENEVNATGQTFHLQYKIVTATTSVTVNGLVSASPEGFSGLATYIEDTGGPPAYTPVPVSRLRQAVHRAANF